jgi:RNAse (barnase) inhibitor barstar
MILGELPVHFASPEAADALRDDEALRIVQMGGTARSGHEVLKDLGNALELPEYYGENWDALDECLRDIETDAIIVLVIADAASLWASVPDAMRLLVDVWISAAADRGGDLHLVFVW